MAGRINVNGATVFVDSIQAPTATVYASSGVVSFLNSAVPSVIQNFYVSGTVTGPGDIEVCGSFTWQAGTMSGTGKTVLCPGSVGTIGSPTAGSVTLDRRWLINKGDLTWTNGAIVGRTGAILSNRGVFHANSESGDVTPDTSAGLSTLVNHGEVRKDVGTTKTRICFQLNQEGTLSEVSGVIERCGAWNEEASMQEEPAECILEVAAEDLDMSGPPADELIMSGRVTCSREVDLIAMIFMADGSELPDPEMERVCINTERCGPVIYVGKLPTPLGDRECVPWVVSTVIVGGNQPEPVRGLACLPGVEHP